MRARSKLHRYLHQVLHHTEFGFWAGVPILVFAVVAALLGLIVNLMYVYAHPNVNIGGVDPVTTFVVGIAMVWVCGYLLRGLRRRSVWAAVGLIVAMPLLYVLTVEGLVTAVAGEQTYFANHWRESLNLEVLPASVLVALYGTQALGVVRERFRRLRL
ncbi:MAG: hypothetical protein JWN01_23 [Patescibacteria group bacterium]|nr:hypothetical protein [Patescibacteria group bacterium]